MHLLLALFGAMCIGGFKLSDRINKSYSDRTLEYSSSVWDQLDDFGVFQNVWNIRLDDILSVIPEPDLVYIYGVNWREVVDSAIEYYTKYKMKCCGDIEMDQFTSTQVLLRHLYLSQKGYMSRSISSIKLESQFLRKELPDNSRVIQRTLQLMERNIRRTHPNLDIQMLKPKSKTSNYVSWDFDHRNVYLKSELTRPWELLK